jgi:GAF domain-containing protein
MDFEGMSLLPEDRLLDLKRRVAELEQESAARAGENTRLQHELSLALDRQKATTQIFSVINNAGGNLASVFDCILEKAHHLCGAPCGSLQLFENNRVAAVAIRGMTPAFTEFLRRGYPITEGMRKRIMANHPVQISDVVETSHTRPEEGPLGAALELGGVRTMIAVPLMKDGVAFGRIIAARQEVHPFEDKQIALLEGFAAQAVLAIENARLFNETREALERQTATADILKVIASSPADVQPVFEAIVNSAARLFAPSTTVITTLKDGKLHWNALATLRSDFDFSGAKAVYPIPFDPDRAPSARAILERRIIEIPDTNAPDTPEFTRKASAAGGFRSATFVPLVHREKGIGTIILTHPQPGFRLSEKQLALVQTFADQAVIAIENARLFNETREALERQTATADILKVIASSPSDVQPVFDAIATSAKRLIGGFSSTVFRFIEDTAYLVALTPTTPAADQILKSTFPRPATDFAPFRMAQAGEVMQIPNTEALSDEIRDIARARGFRSMLFAPLMNKGASIGFIAVTRLETGGFSDHHVQLLRTFADQAVIAIENARLFDEVQQRTRDLSESLQQQTATADVLKVISRSAFDLQTVLDALLTSACRLSQADIGTIRYEDGSGNYRLAATYGCKPEWIKHFSGYSTKPDRSSVFGQTIISGHTVHIPDVLVDPDFKRPEAQKLMGFRAALGVPLLREGQTFGVINLFRSVVGSFEDRQIELVETFADQAVIAIENVRLFDEVQASTRDLTEALKYQTGSANILKVIASSPADVVPVLNAIVESACDLCEAYDAVLTLKNGEDLVRSAHHGPIPTGTDRWSNDRTSVSGRAIADQMPVHLHDVLSEEGAEFSTAQQMSRGDGCRTILAAPMLSEGKSIGTIVLRRAEVRPFNETQINLLQTFADQAVIAIENARLFDEVQAKTRDLEESLRQQTATADVLKVISRSAFDLQAVLDTLTESAARLCNADCAAIARQSADGGYYHATRYNFSADWERISRSIRLGPERGSLVGRVLLARSAVQIADVLADPEYAYPEQQKAGNYHTLLGVPLLRSGEPIGVLFLCRKKVEPFSDKQIELVQTFADQAVIAIENARLFDEVQARTRELSESLQVQTASAEVLKVISRSPDRLQPVLDVIVETSRELCNALTSVIFLLRDGNFHDVAESSTKPEYIETIRANPISQDQRGSVLARAAREKRTIHVPNTAEDSDAGLGGPMDSGGPRSLLSVPLIRDGDVIGGITLRQSHLTPFTPRQIEAVESFADQAVIAISNVNLFEQVQERTRELSRSLDDLRTAQDRLIQTEKLASLGQLTAGIAHEIKNPLNFVNNFSAVSSELIDELKELLMSAAVEDKARPELDELMQTLKSNLEKVVQHGKRADSIVKNMLLHSREGGGEHRLTDINAMVEESLNLAYHGARAERPGFNITLKRELDPNAGLVDVYPQEITRVLLNLISNGFYAATKRRQGECDGFEPILCASTKDLGNKVAIRIRDNGTGIPQEVREKIFNPFFTTKPAGEGTGLGLSMSHDIVVKQHGGKIDVAIEPGTFTEFIITLPRKLAAQGDTTGGGS